MVLIGDLTKTDESVQSPVPFISSFSKSLTDATGTQAIIGIGFRPSYVQFFCGSPSGVVASWGFDNGSVARGVCHNDPNGPNEVTTTADAMRLVTSVLNAVMTGVIQTMDVDGFTISWTRTNAPTGTVNVNFIAYK